MGTEVYKKTMTRCTFLFFEDGNLLTPIVTANETDVINNLARGSYSYNNTTMYYRATDGAAPSTHKLRGSSRSHDSVHGILYVAGINGLKLDNVTVRYFAPNSLSSSSVQIDNCTNIVLSAVSITQNRHGLSFSNDNDVSMDSNCSITHNRIGGIIVQGNSNNITISGEISYNGRDKNYDETTYTYKFDSDGIGVGGLGGNMKGLLITHAIISYNGSSRWRPGYRR